MSEIYMHTYEHLLKEHPTYQDLVNAITRTTEELRKTSGAAHHVLWEHLRELQAIEAKYLEKVNEGLARR